MSSGEEISSLCLDLDLGLGRGQEERETAPPTSSSLEQHKNRSMEGASVCEHVLSIVRRNLTDLNLPNASSSCDRSCCSEFGRPWRQPVAAAAALLSPADSTSNARGAAGCGTRPRGLQEDQAPLLAFFLAATSPLLASRRRACAGARFPPPAVTHGACGRPLAAADSFK